MKSNYYKTIFLVIGMILTVLLNTFILDLFSPTNIYYIIFWAIIFLCTILLVGFEKKQNLHQIDIIQTVIIYVVTYIILIYIFGIFIGFIKSPYKVNSFVTFKIILFSSIIIVLQELTRYTILKKIKENIILILLFLLLYISIDLVINIKFYDLSNIEGIFEVINLLIIPTVATNLLLTYIIIKSTYSPAVLYRFMLNIIIYVAPIYPNLGIYIESILSIMLPTLLFLKLNNFYSKKQYSNDKHINKNILYIPLLIILSLFIGLNSGIFRFYTLAVGSESMTPNINKGDVAVIEKLNERDITKLTIGEIIIYEHNEILIMHRIVDINISNNKYIFQTKGDYNNQIDDYVIQDHQIKGKVHLRVPLIGFPSIWLSEFIK